MANKSSQLLKKTAVLEELLRSVIYNKYDIIAINKPYGLPVQGNAGLTISTLLEDFAKIKGLKTKPHLANRLDRDTTGIVLLSSSQSSAQYLAEMFRERKVRKTYWSVVVGTPKYDQGNICIPLREAIVNGRHMTVLGTTHHSGTPNEDCSLEDGGTKPAETNYKILARNQQTCSLLELNPITGYKHQLRVHLAKGLHTAILGDHKYGNERQPQVLPLRMLQMLGFKGVKNENSGKKKIKPWQRALIPLHLHAKQVILPGLEKDHIVIKAPIPDHFNYTLSSLKLDPARMSRRSSKREKMDKRLRELGISTNLKTGF